MPEGFEGTAMDTAMRIVKKSGYKVLLGSEFCQDWK
jgi:hypothetical protein